MIKFLIRPDFKEDGSQFGFAVEAENAASKEVVLQVCGFSTEGEAQNFVSDIFVKTAKAFQKAN